MSSFKSTYATDNRVESTIHIISHYLRAATNKLGAKKAYTDYFVMTGNLVEELINSYQNRDAKSALVVDDIGLQVINRLIQEGVKDITLALARVPEENLETVKYIIHNTFTEFNIKIVSIEETKGMNIDLVIANPPYGKIGAEITKKIIDTVDFKEYINLEPASDFISTPNKSWHHFISVKRTNGFGGDAHVLPSIIKINKAEINDYDLAAYISNLTISNLIYAKYFNLNNKRNNTVNFLEETTDVAKTFDTRLIFGVIISADSKNHSNGCCVGGTPTGSIWKFNHQTMTLKSYYEHRKSNGFWGVLLEFNSINERNNAFNFIYSSVGFKFCNALTSVMGRDRFHAKEHEFWFPKVDWTRGWTVEEILADYGYTEDEIKEVMDDLKNYKGMED